MQGFVLYLMRNDTLNNFFSPILSCGKLWSYANMLTQTMHKSIPIRSAVAMVTCWCILLLGFSALLLALIAQL